METTIKSVSAVLAAPAPHMVGDGFKVSNFFPGGYKIKMSPFYMLDFNDKIDLPPTHQLRGVGVHPHRGFETVTIAYHGAIAHHDSAGNSGIIYPGDVQWMTAASGILHKEYHEKEFSKKGGPFQMVQLWVNLPAKDKMSKPKYQAIQNDTIGSYVLPLNAGTVEVIAGQYMDVKGAATTFSPMSVYNVRLNADGDATFSFPADFNTGILIVEGNLVVNGEQATGNEFVYFKNDGEEIKVKAAQDSIILVLSGEPIHEPIAQYGPFLMNNQAEIKLAISDYNEGKFGYLED
ncbi:pirin family protein [Pedobacter sp. WC2423]|uniref:pirin family protein n=1 Tax=Pedobacter sp. WC2423 TaxID=3234142 RepID=UPI00346517CA